MKLTLLRRLGQLTIFGRNQAMRMLLQLGESDIGQVRRSPAPAAPDNTRSGMSTPDDLDHMLHETLATAFQQHLQLPQKPITLYVSHQPPRVFVSGRGDVIPQTVGEWLDGGEGNA